MSKSKGLVIAFDGSDGIGKSTQVELAAEYFRNSGHKVHTTRASGGTPIGEQLRKVSLSHDERLPEVDLYISLAMHTALGYDLQARKAVGQICLVDRSPLAIIAYNTIASQLKDQQLGFNACENMLKLWKVDLLIVFTANKQVLDERRAARKLTDAVQANNYYEAKDEAFHRRTQEGYEIATKLVHDHPEWGIKLVEIDADGSVQDIQAAVSQQLDKLL